MKINSKSFLSFLLLGPVLLACSAPSSIQPLSTFRKRNLTYQLARTMVTGSEKVLSSQSTGLVNLDKKSTNTDPYVLYFLNRYQSVNVNYKIATINDSYIDANFEIRGEVFLRAIQENRVSITASMPIINHLFMTSEILANLETINTNWKGSDEALIAPFNEKYVYYEAAPTNHFGYELKDFSSTANGLVTTETSNEFAFNSEDNRLSKWQFQFWNKDESTGGTRIVNKTIIITFDWILKS
jgi:hypothetical protein